MAANTTTVFWVSHNWYQIVWLKGNDKSMYCLYKYTKNVTLTFKTSVKSKQIYIYRMITKTVVWTQNNLQWFYNQAYQIRTGVEYDG